MKLEDFQERDVKYDINAIATDAELTREIQNRLIELDLLDPPVDGLFGPVTTAAFERFQTLMDCQEPGFLGAVTARKLLETDTMPAPKPVLKTVRETFLKARPIQSSDLEDSEKQKILADREFELLDFSIERNHLRIALRRDAFSKLGGDGEVSDSKIWYAFDEHVRVFEGDEQVFPKPKPETVKLEVPYQSQLDNWFNPTGSCNVTSLAMCLQYLGASRRDNIGQFEDELYEYAINEGLSRHNPYDLARIVRDYGCQDEFRENATIEQVKDWLADGNPVVVHGYFTSFGHIVVLVGYDDDGFFVHDPYGEWFPGGYRTDLDGAYLHYSYRLIRRLCIPDGSFWVHFISK
jgi:uncharacterized protein YvpB